ncbi:hypothetical protein LX32DRAFT_633531 [Colletotrichum zoysiae]|uniref:Uncharacterized protein n=1 Tax=Colletotrichum zoysiae TaxID=1216348 RepID=A0AAD9HU65_9PEZI|nr:hypothetical protein LX32DRAFT_633531 [Colletotrichum zoysiae]
MGSASSLLCRTCVESTYQKDARHCGQCCFLHGYFGVMIPRVDNGCPIVSHGCRPLLFLISCFNSLSVRPTTDSDPLPAQREIASTGSEREVTTNEALPLSNDVDLDSRYAQWFLRQVVN